MLFEIDDIRKESFITNPDEGFIKGNSFKNLYDPYKNYEPKKIIPTKESDLLLYNIYKYAFGINDLNLYLDLNPNDTKTYETLKKYIKEYHKNIETYESIYGPLTICNEKGSNFSWLKVKMPWEDSNV